MPERADTLMQDVFRRFRDEGEMGFFFTSDDHEELISRKKIWFDNAIPSGNASLVQSLSSLYTLTANDQYAAELNNLRKAYPSMAARAPSAVAHALSAYTMEANGYRRNQDQGHHRSRSTPYGTSHPSVAQGFRPDHRRPSPTRRLPTLRRHAMLKSRQQPWRDRGVTLRNLTLIAIRSLGRAITLLIFEFYKAV